MDVGPGKRSLVEDGQLPEMAGVGLTGDPIREAIPVRGAPLPRRRR